MKVLAGLFLIILALGCVNNVATVAKGDNIAVDYTGRLEDGSIFDTSVGRAPLEFEAGAGEMIKGFDDAVIGMKLNEEKNITIRPEEAYGAYDVNAVIEVTLASIPNGTKAGDTLYAGGRQVKVLEIRNETAVIDTNHPLAGKTLIFQINIVNIQKTNSTVS